MWRSLLLLFFCDLSFQPATLPGIAGIGVTLVQAQQAHKPEHHEERKHEDIEESDSDTVSDGHHADIGHDGYQHDVDGQKPHQKLEGEEHSKHEGGESGETEEEMGKDGDEHGEEHGEEHGGEHGGEHGEEHGGKHGEEHGEEHEGSQVVAITVSLMLMGFVAFNMVLIYLVNWSDENIRSASYKMIATTISIFCAVLFNEAEFSFIFKQLLAGKGGRGLGIEVTWVHKVISGVIAFMVHFGLINYLCYRFSGSEQRRFAVKSLLAHIAAFAGIKMFGELQLLPFFAASAESALLIALLATVCLAVLGSLSSMWREKKSAEMMAQSEFGGADFFVWQWRNQQSWMAYARADSDKIEEAYKVHQGGGEATFELQMARIKVTLDLEKRMQLGAENDRAIRRYDATEERERWSEDAQEGEDDAFGLIVSFLVLQAFIKWQTGGMHAIHGTHDKMGLTTVLSTFVVGFMWLSALGAFTSALHMCCGGKIQNSRAISAFNSFLAMSMAWTFERAGEWEAHRTIPETSMAQVASGFGITFFSVICVFIVDKIADNTADARREKKTVVVDEPSEDGQCCESVDDDTQGLVMVEAGVEKEIHRLKESGKAHLKKMQNIFADEDAHEKALRTVINGFGTLVGLAWDISFEAATETLMEGFKTTREHPVISKIGLGMALIAVVLPAWYWYIAPLAYWPVELHLECISRDKRMLQELNTQGRGILVSPYDQKRKSQSPSPRGNEAAAK